MKHKGATKISTSHKFLMYLFGFNIIFAFAVLLLLPKLPPLIPVFYGAPKGLAQVGSKNAIFIPTIVSLIAILLSFVFSEINSDHFLKRTFIVSSAFLTFLSFYTTIRIILLVGNF